MPTIAVNTRTASIDFIRDMVRFLSHGFQHYLVDVGARATRRKKTFGEAMNLQNDPRSCNRGASWRTPHAAAQRGSLVFKAECIRLLLTTVLRLRDKLVKVA